MIRFLKYFCLVGSAILGIFLFFFASFSDQTAVFEKYYIWLFGLNSLVAMALLWFTARLLIKLYKRYQQKEFGTRLLTKLVLLFATLAILPGALIYLVSVQFVVRSIESGFDTRVEKAINAGLNLGRSALDNALMDLVSRAHRLAQEAAELSESNRIIFLARALDQNKHIEATIVNSRGVLRGSTTEEIHALWQDVPTHAMLRRAQQGQAFADYDSPADPQVSGMDDARLSSDQSSIRLRVVVQIPRSERNLSLHKETQFLQLIEPVAESIRSNTDTLISANTQYQALAASRLSLRKIYIATLTLTLLLAVFAAIVSAFLLAANLIRPILLLAQGTQAVAEGNLSPTPIIASTDELGSLTKSFHLMTQQLLEARVAVEKNRKELQNAKVYLESLLANMSAGVMVLDKTFHLITCNESVERILQLPIEKYIGQVLVDIPGMQLFAEAILKRCSEQNAQLALKDQTEAHWQEQIELPLQTQESSRLGSLHPVHITLLARGAPLPISSGFGHVVVFDDITDIISAQRSIAWGEVGRRLAHEIKNPLTPIQLSAERLQMKLQDKLSPADVAVLNKSTTTIINQVASMKSLVDDFRDYARMPPTTLAPLNLNALVDEVLNLYNGGNDADIIAVDLSPTLPTVMGDATQLRQVIHNLLQNAQDAVLEKHGETKDRQIKVSTEVVQYVDSHDQTQQGVSLTIADNGAGFSHQILAHAFEPYITTKARGTGLGLAVVKKIIEEHGGRVDIKNRSDEKGAKVMILLLKLAPNH